jgi:SAM-dependent methyltransferase
VWAGVELPHVYWPDHDTQTQLTKYLPIDAGYSLIEIGCAPGGWLAYFNRQFKYAVSGVEYAKNAAAATYRNMSLLGIEAEILTQDFFLLDCERNKYDLVFSAGFIEHFLDLSPVMDRICALSRRYVITIVPNTFGINGCISKTIRPTVYAEHNPIDAATLDFIHTERRIKTLFCDYVGGVRLIMPGSGNKFFEKHNNYARVVNAPVKVLNHISEALVRGLSFVPRTRLFSDRLLYIGIKDGA